MPQVGDTYTDENGVTWVCTAVNTVTGPNGNEIVSATWQVKS